MHFNMKSVASLDITIIISKDNGGIICHRIKENERNVLFSK